MTPNIIENVPLEETGKFTEPVVKHKKREYSYQIVYTSTLILLYWNIGGLYGLYLCCTSAKWATLGFLLLMYLLSGLGVTAGAHRLWSHRSYKATLPLQIFLMLCQTMVCQKTVLNWVRDHRLHHKYTDTDADPHNSTRGFFFSHIGWLMQEKHPEVINRGKELDMSDLLSNPVLRFQKKYYLYLAILLGFLLPTLIPVLLWDETLHNAYHAALFCLLWGSHITLSINSVAHMFGNKPYDKTMSPVQSTALSAIAFGEGYHNYHHVFPFDYRVSELGNKYINISAKFIDFCAWCGLAYDLRFAPQSMIDKRAERTGDGTDLWGKVRKDTRKVDQDVLSPSSDY